MPPSPPTGPKPSDDLRRLLYPEWQGEGFIKVFCPYHEDKLKPSGAIYARNFYCYGCGVWKPAKDIRPIIGSLKVEAVVSGGEQYLPQSLAAAYAAILNGPRQHRKEWLYQRGFTDDTIRWAHLGHTGQRFALPIFEVGNVRLDGPGKLVAAKFRHDPAYDTCADECACFKYTGVKGHNRGVLYAPLGLSDHIVLCEGEFDALLLAQHGIRAVSSISGCRDTQSLEPLRGLRNLIIVMDQDKAGREGALAVQAFLGHGRIVWWRTELDEQGKVVDGPKDVTDAIMQRGFAWLKSVARL